MAKMNTANVSLETQRAVEQFLFYQAEVADGGRWDEWLELFTADGKYWMPASAGQTVAEGVPSIFYEDLFLMEMRIKRVLHPNAHSQAPEQRLSRVVSNVMIESEDAATGDVVVRSKFHLVEYRLETQRFFGGKYRHTLKKTDGGYRIQLQRVDIANVEGPFDYVLQTWL
ncbi:MAG: aromatic-ring-hydroxylating dioxygenase subunit beta [Hyphomicrobiales bacterium]|nr:aromatic-ring-hydroxylating dioxygenase subunit beta [Hyphomicrobiales bacterium]